MRRKGFLIAVCILAYFNLSAQNKAIYSIKKPKTDSTTKAKGFLGGRLDTGIANQLTDLQKKSSEAEEIISDLGMKNMGIKASMLARRLKKKPILKDIYEQIKTERRAGNYGSGTRATIEEINVVKYVEDEALNPYVQEIWWFDLAQSRIVNASLKENKTAQICHGPFARYVNERLVEQGFFYMGAKDGRWETYDADGNLIDKQYYTRGFSAASTISYYDVDKKKIKEVIPIVYGKIRGQYLFFYPGGNLKEEGKLDDDVRVGRWREYHEFGSGGRLKKEWRYGKDKFDAAEPVLLQERDDKAKIIFQDKSNAL